MPMSLDIDDYSSKIEFVFDIAKTAAINFSENSKTQRIERISSVLKNNGVRHFVTSDRVVVCDLRIMESCCEFAWFINIENVVAKQMTKSVISYIENHSFPTVICQEETEVSPVYQAENDVVVVTTVIDSFPSECEIQYQMLKLSSTGEIQDTIL